MCPWSYGKVTINRLYFDAVPEVELIGHSTVLQEGSVCNDSFKGCHEECNVSDVPWDVCKCKGSNLQSAVEERTYLYCNNAWSTQHMPKSTQPLARLSQWSED